MKTTQQRHTRRIQRVIDHIHDHSADDIDSAAVAEVAQLSAYQSVNRELTQTDWSGGDRRTGLMFGIDQAAPSNPPLHDFRFSGSMA